MTDDAGQPLPPGQQGQIVLTNLINYSMPFVRYAIGDLGALAEPEARCPCGRGLPLLDHVTGRSSDQLTLPGGRQLLMWYFTDVFRQTPGIDSFQMRQEAPDHILIQIVPAKALAICLAGRPAMADRVPTPWDLTSGRRTLSSIFAGVATSRCAVKPSWKLYLVDSIPAGPGGKHRFFVADTAAQAGAGAASAGSLEGQER